MATGFFTDTTLCIGCKACEVACKQWNQLPADGYSLSGMSYDNTTGLGATTWRHVAFVEQFDKGTGQFMGLEGMNGGSGGEAISRRVAAEGANDGLLGDSRWLMMSNVCKHCTNAGCLECCPTGAIIRNEFGDVYVQPDICNGCGYCQIACPFGVIELNHTDGRAWKCTLCYDRQKDGLTPACAKACPTQSIQFGEVSELQQRARERVGALHARGVTDAYLYGVDERGSVGDLNAFFLLVDKPEVYNLPEAPHVPQAQVLPSYLVTVATGALLGAATLLTLFFEAEDIVTVGNQRYDRPRNQILLPGLRARRGSTRGTVADAPSTYYGRPMIKAPHWKWYVPGYFFIAGIAAGVAFFGALARFFGGPRHRVTVRHARYLALALSIICPVLLILDLGRPRRFFHMLRVVKVRSPLSLGTWILMAFGVTSGLLAARQMAEDGFILRRRSFLSRLALLLPDRLLTLLQGALGLGLGGYTGVLLAATAVPLWAAAGILLGPLFLAASITSGAAALILLGLLSGRQSRAARADLEIVASVGAITQLGLAAAHEAFVPERIGQPLRHGVWGRVFRYGVLGGGLIAPMGLRLLAWRSGARMERIFSALSAISTLLGTLAERFALVEAGKASARDPLAYQELTAGAPGEARPTPAEQGRRTANAQPYRPGVSARDTAPQTSPSAKPVE